MADIGRHFSDVCVQRQHGGKGRRAEAQPFHTLQLAGHAAANLADGGDAGAVDADGAVHAAFAAVLIGIGVKGRALIMRREEIFHILHRDLAIGHQRPGNIVALGAELGVRAVPAVGQGTEESPHEPGARGVVDVIHVGVRAENVARVEGTVLIQVKAVIPDKLAQIL